MKLHTPCTKLTFLSGVWATSPGCFCQPFAVFLGGNWATDPAYFCRPSAAFTHSIWAPPVMAVLAARIHPADLARFWGLIHAESQPSRATGPGPANFIQPADFRPIPGQVILAAWARPQVFLLLFLLAPLLVFSVHFSHWPWVLLLTFCGVSQQHLSPGPGYFSLTFSSNFCATKRGYLKKNAIF